MLETDPTTLDPDQTDEGTETIPEMLPPSDLEGTNGGTNDEN